MSEISKGQRVRVRSDALSAWRGDYGKVVRTDAATAMAVIDLEKDKLRIGFWIDELEPATNPQ